MWRQILPPILFVILAWICTSAVTTYYMAWLEQSYQRDFSEHVGSIRATNRLERSLWKLVSTWPSNPLNIEPFERQWSQVRGEIAKEQEALRATSRDEGALGQLELLDSLLAQYVIFIEENVAIGPLLSPLELVFRRDEAYQRTDEITLVTASIRRERQDLLEREASRRDRIRFLVYAARFSLLAIGPILGIYFGWRFSQQLHHTVARISVILSDSGMSEPLPLGTVSIYPFGDLNQVQQQAKAVISRLHAAHGELQTARQEMIRTERLAAVGELAAGVAHELRNPLTAVKLLLQLAVEGDGERPLAPNQWRLVLEEIGRVEGTIQGLIDFARPRAPRKLQHDFAVTLQRALNLMEGRAKQGNIHIDCELASGPLLVHGDPELLHQVCVNLLLNAFDAMPQGGNMKVQLRALNPQMLELRLEDSGTGISPEILTKLFEPFATSKEHGTGLGLAISRRIVLDHAGTIQAENRAGGGAVFTVRLPLSALEQPLKHSV